MQLNDALMDVVRQAEVVGPLADLSLMDPGAILVEIADTYDESLGDPAIHFFQVVQRDGERVALAGIAKELIPGTEYEHDLRNRVLPVKEAFVRGCRTCRDAAAGEARSDFAAIDEARWFAHDGTGARHDPTSSQFEHPFADYVPTATLTIRFHGSEPYLRPGPSAHILMLVPRDEDLRRNAMLLPDYEQQLRVAGLHA